MPKPVRRASAVHLERAMEGLAAPVEVRRDPRARRFTLRVNEARRGAVLTLPPHVSFKEAGDFLSRHRRWLERRLAAIPRPVPFADGAVVPLRGVDHRLRFVGRARGQGVARVAPPAEGAPAPLEILVAGEPAHAPRRLADWLKREARRDLAERVAWHAERLAARPRRLSVRDQSTRWGSCSSAGALTFSWRLILAPPFVLDYVAAHEVAHLLEMNHGPRFWRLVAGTVPRLEEARAWLRTQSNLLHRYGAEP